jgi:hypothetical protein
MYFKISLVKNFQVRLIAIAIVSCTDSGFSAGNRFAFSYMGVSDYNIVGNSINLAGTSDQIAVIQGGFTPDSFLFV